MLQRELQLLTWLQNSGNLSDFRFSVASEDASFRRYFRLFRPGLGSLIVMDAPPDKEDCTTFVAMTARLQATGVHVPRILAQDLQQGFLLLEDLGEQVYLDHLQPERVDELYAAALRALLCIQLTGSKAGLACYDAALLQQEMQLFIDWFLCRYLGLTLSAAEQAMLQACFALLAEAALTQPQVLVHRDFHSRNLLICADNSPGIIDYQDAVLGPVTYDVVSLLRDSYISWPQAQVDAWLASYADQAVAAGLLSDAQRQALPEWFDLMGMQRHLKVVGIFARLHLRDGKSSYLADIPQTLRYLLAVAQRYPVLLPLAFFIQQRVPVEMREGVST